MFVFTPLFKKVSSGVQPMLLELNTNERADVEVSTGNISIQNPTGWSTLNTTSVWLDCAYRNSHNFTTNLWGCLSVFFRLLSVSLIVVLSDVPLMRATGAGGSQESKVQQTSCGLSPEQPPENVRYRGNKSRLEEQEERQRVQEKLSWPTCGGDTWWGGVGWCAGGKAMSFVTGMRPLADSLISSP